MSNKGIVPVVLSGAAAAAAFAPTDITGLMLWLKSDAGLYQERTGASATTPASADADPIGTWLDQSGNSKHHTAGADSTRPTHKVNIINGRAISRGDNSDDVLSASIDGTALTALSVYGVIRTRADISGAALGFWSWASTDKSGTPFAVMQTNVGTIRVHVNNGYRFTVAALASTVYQVCLRHTGTAWDFRVNGVDEAQYVGARANQAGAATTYIHSGFNASGQEDFGEWLIYNSNLTGTDNTNVESYLRTRWAAY
jgi:hypothetical protein